MTARIVRDWRRRILRPLLVVPLRRYFRSPSSAWAKDRVWRTAVSCLGWLDGDVDARMRTGQTIRVDTSDIIGRYLDYFGQWEPHLTAWLGRTLVAGDVFVDVGANVGYFSLLASSLVGRDGLVVAIEPLGTTYAQLRANLDANHAANVRPVHTAVWDEDTTLQLYGAASRSGRTTVYPAWAAHVALPPAERVRARRLASVLTADEIRRAKAIKIDVEGAEWRTLLGLAPALSQCRDDVSIVVEISPELLATDGCRPDQMLAFMKQRGFFAYRLANTYAAREYYDPQTQPPVRIDALPDVGQYDVVFSRIDAATL